MWRLLLRELFNHFFRVRNFSVLGSSNTFSHTPLTLLHNHMLSDLANICKIRLHSKLKFNRMLHTQ